MLQNANSHRRLGPKPCQKLARGVPSGKLFFVLFATGTASKNVHQNAQVYIDTVDVNLENIYIDSVDVNL